ncbi:hypothetical protein [Shewanella donghaensis]|uniref:hypothetical protein n=1 Tax=Shewanella donghaensis TaxID=238836 RepID=UPI0011828305|nr:hypothetical protein [Shewanella donghaensis]
MFFSKSNQFEIGTRWGQLVAKVTLLLCSIILLLYYCYFFISPSLTISNQSSHIIESSYIALPHSRLDFGVITEGATNTIHYDLAQFDGQYLYEISLDSGAVIKGACGYITNFEFNKRVTLTLSENTILSCTFG